MATNSTAETAAEGGIASDKALLARFVESRDEAAFGELVERHAPLVLSVCRRAAPSPVDAEDAFQATFIVLTKSAHKVRRPESLAAWLYGVAYRVSARLRRDVARRKAQPLEDTMSTRSDPLDELLARHEEAITDEEVAALPESLRTPFVLRYLAGQSNEEVAASLGISESAVEGRLKRAKQKLRSRLVRRGLTLATAVVVFKSTRVVASQVPVELVSATLQTCFGTGAEAATAAAQAGGSSTALQLANQEVIAMKTLMLTKPLIAAIVTGCVATFAVGLQYAPFTGREAVAQRASTQLNTGPAGGAAEKENTRSTEPIGEIRIPMLPPRPVGADDGPAIEVFDRKVRSAVEKQIAAALAKMIRSGGLDFNDAPLEQVISAVADEYNIPVMVDKPALEDAGLAVDEPVTIKVKGNMSLRSAMRNILRQHNLTYIVQDEVLLITTPTVEEEQLETRVYPVDDSKTAGTLQKLILSHVRPDSWAASGGGTAEISGYSGGVVVTQSYEGHEQIHNLLKQLGWPSPAK